MRYCKKRRNVNLDGIASSKRSLFRMIVAIAAACSVLHERAAFATSFGSFARTLLQFCSHFRIMYGASLSFYVKKVKDGNFKFHDFLVVLDVFLWLRVGDFLYLSFIKIQLSLNLEAGPRRGTDARRYWFSKFPLFPTPFP